MAQETKMDVILVVDDDPEIRKLLADYLEKNGLKVHRAQDGREMKRVLENEAIDLIVLDLMLPDTDGLTLCRDLRANSLMPIIMLTARGEETDRIIGIEMGADDYLVKPFNPRELLARIRTILRRTRALPPNLQKEPARFLHFSGWTLDTGTRTLSSPQKVLVPLSGTEYRLLHIFLEHPNRVLSRDQLIQMVQGREAEAYDRVIDVQISRLRQRLEGSDLIQTVRGEGYVLASVVEAAAS